MFISKSQLEGLTKDQLVELVLELQSLKLDPLTGCLRREVLRDLPDCRRYVVAMVDINDLKIINDTFGHPAGDDIIKFVAGMVKSVIRSEDTLIRYGGDEFLTIFNDVNVEQARKIMSRIKTDAATWGVGSSYTLEAAIKAADEEMYSKKKKRKGGK